MRAGDLTRLPPQVHFGQKIQIRCSSALVPHQPYLKSSSKTPTSFSRYSRNQEVVMSTKGDWSTVWEVQYLDPQFKMEMEGQPVPTNAPVSLMHCATRGFLLRHLLLLLPRVALPCRLSPPPPHATRSTFIYIDPKP